MSENNAMNAGSDKAPDEKGEEEYLEATREAIQETESELDVGEFGMEAAENAEANRIYQEMKEKQAE